MNNKAKKRTLAQDAAAVATLLTANLANPTFIRAHRAQMRQLARLIEKALEDDKKRRAA